MIKLSEHFSYLKLRRFTFPSIFMLIFTSAYGIVDGFFVSNFVGKIEFTALNFIMPFVMLLGCSIDCLRNYFWNRWIFLASNCFIESRRDWRSARFECSIWKNFDACVADEYSAI